MKVIPAITIALLSLAFGVVESLRPSAPKLPARDIDLPFGPEDVSVVRHVFSMADKLVFLGGEIRMVDTHFICPTLDLLPSLLKYCEERRTKIYVKNAFDCDNLAAEFSVNAARWAVGKYGTNLTSGIAVGEAYVWISGPVEGLQNYPPCGHALNVLCLSNGQLIFIEPTTGKWVNVESAIYEGVIEVEFVRM